MNKILTSDLVPNLFGGVSNLIDERVILDLNQQERIIRGTTASNKYIYGVLVNNSRQTEDMATLSYQWSNLAANNSYWTTTINLPMANENQAGCMTANDKKAIMQMPQPFAWGGTLTMNDFELIPSPRFCMLDLWGEINVLDGTWTNLFPIEESSQAWLLGGVMKWQALFNVMAWSNIAFDTTKNIAGMDSSGGFSIMLSKVFVDENVYAKYPPSSTTGIFVGDPYMFPKTSPGTPMSDLLNTGPSAVFGMSSIGAVQMPQQVAYSPKVRVQALFQLPTTRQLNSTEVGIIKNSFRAGTWTISGTITELP